MAENWKVADTDSRERKMAIENCWSEKKNATKISSCHANCKIWKVISQNYNVTWKSCYVFLLNHFFMRSPFYTLNLLLPLLFSATQFNSHQLISRCARACHFNADNNRNNFRLYFIIFFHWLDSQRRCVCMFFVYFFFLVFYLLPLTFCHSNSRFVFN